MEKKRKKASNLVNLICARKKKCVNEKTECFEINGEWHKPSKVDVLCVFASSEAFFDGQFFVIILMDRLLFVAIVA